jgi:hypothetical protein
MLNLVQHPCAIISGERAADDRAWTLKRVQGDALKIDQPTQSSLERRASPASAGEENQISR